MSEERFPDMLRRALGEPPDERNVVQRLDAVLTEAPERARRHREWTQPRGIVLVAGVLTLLVVVGLIATQQALLRKHVSPASAPASCLANAPARLLVVHLATLELIAYENGCELLRTPAATAELEVSRLKGTYQVAGKSQSSLTLRPELVTRPPGPTILIRSADSTPAVSPGPPDAPPVYTLQVASDPLAHLSDWAPLGATVIIKD